MRLDDLVTQLKPRAQRLGLVDAQTGYYDEDEMRFYVEEAMRYLANRYQLQHFLRINRELFRTVSGVESYQIPDNYGFWDPEETRRSGIAVSDSDGTNPRNLTFYNPARYNLFRQTTTARPAWFTVAEDLIYLSPTPDAVYIIEAIERPVPDGEDIPEPYVQSVKIETLWRMAADQGKGTAILADERTQTLRTLVNNESRFRQRFYTSYERPGIGRGRRRYGL